MSSHPLTYYVPCRPTTEEILQWATSASPKRRLRSVTGPPGSGKTVWIHGVEVALNAQEALFVFPVLDLAKDNDEKRLGDWYALATQKAAKRRFHTAWKPTSRSSIVNDICVDIQQLCVGCGAHYPVVLVDAWEEVSPFFRKTIELVLAAVLRSPAAKPKILLTRRDEYALDEATLRWEEEVLSLAPLATPEEQMRRRLQVAGQGAVSWRREPWEAELDWWIATLDEDDRAAHLNALRPVLTLNPYMNSWLLNRVKKGTTTFGQNDFRACLEAYVERAGLPTDVYVDHLLALHQDHNMIFHETGEYPAPAFGGQPDPTLRSLLEASIVVNMGRKGYFVEPGVAALVCAYHGIARPSNPTQREVP